MSGWVTKPLSSVAEVRYGTRVVRKKDGGSLFPVYGGGGATFSVDEFNRENCFIISRFGMSAECVRYVSGRFFLNDSGLTVHSTTDEVLQEFLDRFLVAKQTEIYALSRGTAQRNLDVPLFRAFPISYPKSLEEQRRIVSVLDEAFAAIATATANAEKNVANAREAPSTFIDGILEAEPDQHPMTLADAADPTCTLSYGIVQPGNDVDGGLPIVRPVDLQQHVVGLEGLKRINAKIAMAYQRTALRGDEIFLCVRGTTGTVSLASPELAGGNVTRGIVPIRFDPALLTRAFAYYLMRSAAVQKQIRAATYGTALMQINIGDLKKITLRVPSLERQAALSGRLDRLMTELDTLQDSYSRKTAALVQLK